MSIKCIATDMDGTLLNDKKEKPKEFDKWVLAHPDIKVVIASGRQYYALRRDFEDIAEHLIFIAENGGLVFEKEQILYENIMSYEDVCRCLALAEQMDNVTPVVCGVESAYMNPNVGEANVQGLLYYYRLQLTDDLYAAARQDKIVKVAFYITNHEAEKYFEEVRDKSEGILTVLSGTDWLDLSNETENKGNAMRAIQEKLGILPSECMAFGDYLNDYSLLEACEESYCMENGHPDLKALAKHIAPSNEENGVMQVLETL